MTTTGIVPYIRLLLTAIVAAPSPASATLLLSPDGTTVYDAMDGVNWLVNTNLAATNRFGVPGCKSSGTQPCINPSGSMSYRAAAAWVAALNAANYLGNTNGPCNRPAYGRRSK